MPWTIETRDGRTRVTLHGIVDVCEAAPFHAALRDLARQARDVVVDATACSGIDTSALQLLLAFRRALEAAGGRLTLDAGESPPAGLLARFGLS